MSDADKQPAAPGLTSVEVVVISEDSALWPTAPDSVPCKHQNGPPTADLLPCAMMQWHPCLAAIQTLMDHRTNHLPSLGRRLSWHQGRDG